MTPGRSRGAERPPDSVVFDSTLVAVEVGQKWGGQQIPMIAVAVSDREEVQAYRVGLEMLRAIYRRHKGEFQWRTGSIDRLSGSGRVRTAIELDGIEALIPELERESREFRERSSQYLIYPPL
jgi:uncharacterized protein YbbC (DUF1343 family)